MSFSIVRGLSYEVVPCSDEAIMAIDREFGF